MNQPAVEQVTMNDKDMLEVFLVDSPDFPELLALKRALQAIPGVAKVTVVPGKQNKRLTVTPANPAAALELLAAVKTLTRPQRAINVNFFFGALSPATEATGEFICAAIEFMEPMPTTAYEETYRRFISLIEHHNGPATLLHRHERFFVISFEVVTTKPNRGISAIVIEDMGLAVSFAHPIVAPAGLAAEQLVGELRRKHS